MTNLKRLRKTANHLKFLRSALKVTGEGYGSVRLIMASGEKYVNGKELLTLINICKKQLRNGLSENNR